MGEGDRIGGASIGGEEARGKSLLGCVDGDLGHIAELLKRVFILDFHLEANMSPQ